MKFNLNSAVYAHLISGCFINCATPISMRWEVEFIAGNKWQHLHGAHLLEYALSTHSSLALLYSFLRCDSTTQWMILQNSRLWLIVFAVGTTGSREASKTSSILSIVSPGKEKDGSPIVEPDLYISSTYIKFSRVGREFKMPANRAPHVHRRAKYSLLRSMLLKLTVYSGLRSK